MPQVPCVTSSTIMLTTSWLWWRRMASLSCCGRCGSRMMSCARTSQVSPLPALLVSPPFPHVMPLLPFASLHHLCLSYPLVSKTLVSVVLVLFFVSFSLSPFLRIRLRASPCQGKCYTQLLPSSLSLKPQQSHGGFPKGVGSRELPLHHLLTSQQGQWAGSDHRSGLPPGILWNLSSSDHLKDRLARDTLEQLTDLVLSPLSGTGGPPLIQQNASEAEIFYNATGFLRCWSRSS